MNVLSLFSGIGGLELGLERAGMTVVGQVEINPYCRQVLAKHWPDVPRHDDVRTTVEWWASEERPRVDLICGGFPCQDISNAGARKGITGPKSSLWGGMLHAVRNIRPRYVLIENVAALLVRGVDTVLADLHESGFNAEWSVLSACAMGAPHTRERLFILAYPNNQRLQASGTSRVRDDRQMAFRGVSSEHLHAATQPDRSQRGSHWSSEPGVDRMADGLSAELDRRRLFALGNAVVPQVAEHIGRMILEATA
ncbi:DNA methyltransferase [Mycobacterium phage ShroomBoi]|uniref:Cytosine-specific methyltransferase n=1 Tax=Mycobacterium phage SG4 TaxID=2923001 RepID=G8I9T0_9CAUD|nr:DNA methyltransferase [Mycobacterium phage SG4]AER49474.1 DNA-cytosine methyltransferase [Mycobacterium phage SG4]WKW86488.1 DNA methyltransferase [Mycobacterium phage ShroomBoi]